LSEPESIGAMAPSRCAVCVFGGVRNAFNPGVEWRKSFKFGVEPGEGRASPGSQVILVPGDQNRVCRGTRDRNVIADILGGNGFQITVVVGLAFV